MSALLASLALAFATGQSQSSRLDGWVRMIDFTSNGGLVVQTARLDNQGYHRSLYYTPVAKFAPKLVATSTGEFLQFSPDGRFAATENEHLVTVYRTEDGSHVISAPGRDVGAFSPDGGRYAFCSGFDVKIVDLKNGTVRTLTRTSDAIRRAGSKKAKNWSNDVAAWTPKGLAVDSWYDVPGKRSVDSQFLVDPNTDRVIGRHADRGEPPQRLADGSIIEDLAEVDGHQTRIMRSFKGKKQLIFKASHFYAERINNHDEGPAGFQASPRGMTVIVYGMTDRPEPGQMSIWSVDPLTAKKRLLAKAPFAFLEWWSEGIVTMPVALSPDGKWVAYSDPQDEKVLRLIPVR